MVSALRGAVVPPSAYTHDSATIQKFIADWNAYVMLDARAFDQLVAISGSLVTLRPAVMRFLRATYAAFAAHDTVAVRAARRQYATDVQQLSRSGALPQLTNLSPISQADAAHVAADISRSGDVRRLVRSVRSQYPLSFFAAHFSQA